LISVSRFIVVSFGQYYARAANGYGPPRPRDSA
jgi:hypothetical protein